MSFVSRIICRFVGWNPAILNECSQASYCKLYTFASALVIMMGLWGFNGYAIGDLFLHVSLWACICMAVVFMCLVWNIERIMLLTVGSSVKMAIFRGFLALLMSLFGSTLIDHKFFEDDINKELANQRLKEIHEETHKRQEAYTLEMTSIEDQMELLRTSIDETSEKIAKTPVLKLTTTRSRQSATGEFDENGNVVMAESKESQTEYHENPLSAKLRADQELYSKYDSNLQELRLRKVNVEKEVSEELSGKPSGFLTMLEATIVVVTRSWVSSVAYGVFFFILLFIELFVVCIKMGDNKCDYELIVEDQLELKKQFIEKRKRSFMA